MLLKTIQSMKNDYRLVVLALVAGVLLTLVITTIVSMTVSYSAAQQRQSYYQDVSKRLLTELDNLDSYLKKLAHQFRTQPSFIEQAIHTPPYVDTQLYTRRVTADNVKDYFADLNKKYHLITFIRALDATGKEIAADIASAYYPITETSLGTQLTAASIALDVKSIPEMKQVIDDLHNQAGVHIAAIKAKSHPLAGAWWAMAVEDSDKSDSSMTGIIWLKVDFKNLFAQLFNKEVSLLGVSFESINQYAEMPAKVSIVDMAQNTTQLRIMYANQEMFLNLASKKLFSDSHGMIFASALVCMLLTMALVVWTNIYVRKSMAQRESYPPDAHVANANQNTHDTDQVSILSLAAAGKGSQDGEEIVRQVSDYLHTTSENIAQLVRYADDDVGKRPQLVEVIDAIRHDSEEVGASKLVEICSEYSTDVLYKLDTAEMLNQIQKITTLYTELLHSLKDFQDAGTLPAQARN